MARHPIRQRIRQRPASTPRTPLPNRLLDRGHIRTQLSGPRTLTRRPRLHFASDLRTHQHSPDGPLAIAARRTWNRHLLEPPHPHTTRHRWTPPSSHRHTQRVLLFRVYLLTKTIERYGQI